MKLVICDRHETCSMAALCTHAEPHEQRPDCVEECRDDNLNKAYCMPVEE